VAPGGFTFFILEKGVEGFTADKPEDKHGIRVSDTSPLTLEDVFVPIENVVGGVEGQGMAQAQEVFGYTRLMVAAFGLGGGLAALERAIQYAQERVQAGAPLIEKQAFTHKLLVPHAVRLEASRAYIEETARRIDSGEVELNVEGAIAKLIATEAGNAAADAAIQALGGYGYMKEYEIEKIRRDVRITTIYEGTSEIMEWTIARDRWRSHLQLRGQYYAQVAPNVEALHARAPDVGADIAALALRALQVVCEQARVGRLTRNQHILFRLGEWVALAESAATFARYAADDRAKVSGWSPETVRAMSRIYARDAALRVATEGLRWVYGAVENANLGELEAAMNVSAVHGAQRGLLADMDLVTQSLQAATFE
jgi:alkylation response protein AidB-like acyl-CoA dehydrogenase